MQDRFLSAEPGDLRVSEIPTLLSLYKRLYQDHQFLQDEVTRLRNQAAGPQPAPEIVGEEDKSGLLPKIQSLI